MKRYIILFFISVASVSCGNYLDSGRSGYNDDVVYQREEVNFNQFYATLSPFGNWMTYPGLGQVWVADDPFFKPYYTNGRWAYSRYGWTWVSNYSWGWAPFHYGRWAYDSFYGWMWVPGYTWGPAWVNWRNYNGYYAWSPITANNTQPSQEHWVVVDGKHLTTPQITEVAVTDQRALEVINKGSEIPIKSNGITAGPPPSAVRDLGVKLNRVDVMRVDEVPIPTMVDKQGVIRKPSVLKPIEAERNPLPERNINRRPSNMPTMQPEMQREIPIRRPQQPILQPAPRTVDPMPQRREIPRQLP